MPAPERSGDPADGREVAVGVRATYDAVAREYDRQLGDELDGKPLDRALLTGFVEMVGSGRIADVGCGPGQVTRFLADQRADVLGIDLSQGMITIARTRSPKLEFTVGSMLRLPVPDGTWAGIVALYSIIHLTEDERAIACREFARVLRPGGWLLVAFHVDSQQFTIGEVNRLTTWFGQQVEIDGYFIDPDQVVAQLQTAGFALTAKVERLPVPEVEYPSRRCYLLARRR
ncbi:class I SAM-dependent methyltransferase [Jatrophihabitans lederbergiae]|uniref:Methyltransferase domain-containing protein n=1 Tax=Jatrophihabitans lederbergiae TaxID=3075547 RepID=A0ABU2JFD5_9ACTN|nr:methyltransferase domain-containing protein [Jatrophihabitans sp. DSM 44399]MDT0263690.1 methyltransferase domain-containing protein [Jatrophihabitans sp. DSM 44399]